MPERKLITGCEDTFSIVSGYLTVLDWWQMRSVNQDVFRAIRTLFLDAELNFNADYFGVAVSMLKEIKTGCRKLDFVTHARRKHWPFSCFLITVPVRSMTFPAVSTQNKEFAFLKQILEKFPGPDGIATQTKRVLQAFYATPPTWLDAVIKLHDMRYGALSIAVLIALLCIIGVLKIVLNHVQIVGIPDSIGFYCRQQIGPPPHRYNMFVCDETINCPPVPDTFFGMNLTVLCEKLICSNKDIDHIDLGNNTYALCGESYQWIADSWTIAIILACTVGLLLFWQLGSLLCPIFFRSSHELCYTPIAMSEQKDRFQYASGTRAPTSPELLSPLLPKDNWFSPA